MNVQEDLKIDYHRFLNIPDYLPNIDVSKYKTKGMGWLQFHKQLQFEDLGNDKILPWLNSMGYSSHWIEFFYTPPHEDGIVHSDNIGDWSWAKIVYQIGAKGSTMRWWSSDKAFEVSTTDARAGGDRTDDHYHGKVLVARPEESTIEHEVEVGTSSLINVGPLHSSHNPTDDKRFTITIALIDKDKDYEHRILWDEAIESFKPYIVPSSDS